MKLTHPLERQLEQLDRSSATIVSRARSAIRMARDQEHHARALTELAFALKKLGKFEDSKRVSKTAAETLNRVQTIRDRARAWFNKPAERLGFKYGKQPESGWVSGMPDSPWRPGETS